jgi:hypothetical protein
MPAAPADNATRRFIVAWRARSLSAARRCPRAEVHVPEDAGKKIMSEVTISSGTEFGGML